MWYVGYFEEDKHGNSTKPVAWSFEKSCVRTLILEEVYLMDIDYLTTAITEYVAQN